MAAPVATFKGDIYVQGRILCDAITLPDDTISDEAMIASGVAIAAEKLVHPRYEKYSEATSTTATSKTVVAFVPMGASGELQAIRAALKGKCTSGATVTVDLRKNNVSVLSAVITINDTKADKEYVDGVITTPDYTDADTMELVIVATAGGGSVGTGLMVGVKAYESAA